MQRRARSWWTAPDLFEKNASQWAKHASNCGASNCPTAWVSADSADPPNPTVGDKFPPELYNVDGANYESVNLLFLAIFRGFGGGGDRTTGELNELHLGYSRDGFGIHRPTTPNATRTAFLQPSWPEATWHHTNVQSVGGGLVLADDDTLRIYVSSRSGLPHTGEVMANGQAHSPGGNRTFGFATLRRDGFVSADDTGQLSAPHGCTKDSCRVAGPGILLTRPIVFDAQLVHLFVNVKIRHGGFFQVEILEKNRSLTAFSSVQSIVGSLPAQQTVHNTSGFSSTRARVSWAGADNLTAVAGRPIQLRFILSGVSLYSFWLAESEHCGESRGWLGAGGPGATRGRDMHGSCAANKASSSADATQLKTDDAGQKLLVPGKKRSISWWWDSDHGGSASALIKFCTEHKNIVTRVMMLCEVFTCVNADWTNASAPRGTCTNNNGVGGTITGQLSDKCKQAIPALSAAGIETERKHATAFLCLSLRFHGANCVILIYLSFADAVWLGEDDSILSAKYQFQHVKEMAAMLIQIAKDNPGLSGFQLDLETDSPFDDQDRLDYATFLHDMTLTLKNTTNPLRFSADMECRNPATNTMLSNCSAVAGSGVARVYSMYTYNSADYYEWCHQQLAPALATVPLDTLGIGLGCWVTPDLNNTWNTSPESAEDRVCKLMNESVQEIGMFELNPQQVSHGL